jgi:hypothetical protein
VLADVVQERRVLEQLAIVGVEPVQLRGLVEQLEREASDLPGMLLRETAPPGEPLDRCTPNGARVVGPVGGIVVPDGIEQDPLAQRPFADRHLVEVEHLHRSRQEHRAGDDEIDAARFEPDHPPPLGCFRSDDLVVQGQELVARERELVERGGQLRAAPGRGHGGKVLQGAAAADDELGLERANLAGDRAQCSREVRTQRPPV